jgi:hypothetical protein
MALRSGTVTRHQTVNRIFMDWKISSMSNRAQNIIEKVGSLGIPGIAAFFLVLSSAAYAILTATEKGIDLGYYHNAGRQWLTGAFQIGKGPSGEYPPFTLVLFALMGKLSFEHTRLLWLLLNSTATILILWLVIRWIGSDWPFKAKFYLMTFFLCWASFRVTLRVGQLSLIITALILSAMWAESHRKDFGAGAFLGLSLSKPTLTFPFFFYFIWEKKWKSLIVAGLLTLGLTQIFASHQGKGLIQTSFEYFKSATQTYVSGISDYSGTCEIKPLLYLLSGKNAPLAAFLSMGLILGALTTMASLFHRKPSEKPLQVAVLVFFGLWAVYHRIYDTVACIIPAAVLFDFIVKKKFARMSWFCLAGLALLGVDFPGVLLDRLHWSPARLSSNPLGFLGLHLDRLIVFGLFGAFLVLLWKSDSEPLNSSSTPEEPS